MGGPPAQIDFDTWQVAQIAFHTLLRPYRPCQGQSRRSKELLVRFVIFCTLLFYGTRGFTSYVKILYPVFSSLWSSCPKKYQINQHNSSQNYLTSGDGRLKLFGRTSVRPARASCQHRTLSGLNWSPSKMLVSHQKYLYMFCPVNRWNIKIFNSFRSLFIWYDTQIINTNLRNILWPIRAGAGLMREEWLFLLYVVIFMAHEKVWSWLRLPWIGLKCCYPIRMPKNQ